MTFLWDSEPVVAASAFNPFTQEVAMPVTVQAASTRARPTAKAGGLTRPVRRSLLAMGLACGEAADALEGRAAMADATERAADRSAGAERDRPGDEAGSGAPEDGVGDPAAIAAMTTEIQELGRKRDRLAEELTTLDGERATLQARLLRLLGRHGGRPLAEPALPALPAGTGLPVATWR
jgi:hypothetical protein